MLSKLIKLGLNTRPLSKRSAPGRYSTERADTNNGAIITSLTGNIGAAVVTGLKVRPVFPILSKLVSSLMASVNPCFSQGGCFRQQM